MILCEGSAIFRKMCIAQQVVSFSSLAPVSNDERPSLLTLLLANISAETSARLYQIAATFCAKKPFADPDYNAEMLSKVMTFTEENLVGPAESVWVFANLAFLHIILRDCIASFQPIFCA